MSDQPSYSISKFTKQEIDIIYNQTGSRYRTEWFDIVYAPKIKDFSRILVVTSKKVGNAPKRNKLKRRLKSIFFEEKLFNSSHDYIFIAKKSAVGLSFVQLKDLVISIYQKFK